MARRPTNQREAGRSSPSHRADAVGAALYLTPFDALYAPMVASWVLDERELTWLAPGTPAPLTPQKVASWGGGKDRRMLLWRDGVPRPFGYSELNDMVGRPGQMWIGHFLLDPALRGRGLAINFAMALVSHAFRTHAASDVLLVVFPENEAAIKCYERAGLSVLGRERKFFKAADKEHEFLRMGINADRYHSLLAANQYPVELMPIRSAAKPRTPD